MGLSLLLEGLSVATSVGLGCGTCCGSSAGILLSGFVVTHARDSKQSLAAFLAFFLGKVAAVALLCLVASLIGQATFLQSNLFAQGWVERGFDLFMIGMGLWFLYGWLQEMRGRKTCGNQCRDHKKMREAAEPAPLVIVASLCVTLPVAYALVTGVVFAVASIASPLLLVLMLSGILTTRMHKEIPGVIRWLRLACYLGMIGYFCVHLILSL